MNQSFTLCLKRNLCFSFLLCISSGIALKTQSQICSDPNTLFGLTSGGAIYPINSGTAVVGSKINTSSYSVSAKQANAIGYNNLNGKFYYFNNNPGTGSQKFVSYDPVTNTYGSLANSPITATVHAGTVSFGGTGYYTTDVNGKLYYYNITLDSWTTITSTIYDQYGNNVSTVITSQNSGDMAIDGLGNLWLLTSSTSNYALYKIPTPLPTTAQSSVTAKQILSPASTVPSGSSGFQGVAFDALGNMYLTSASNGLYKMSSTSSLTYVGALTTSGVSNDLSSCSYPVTVLAAIWTAFDAGLQNDHVHMSWSVDDAADVQGFFVEKARDQTRWKELDYVRYEPDFAQYAYTDPAPFSGNNFYRIREVDSKGNSHYSEIRLITLRNAAKISLWPNPAADNIFIVADNISDNTTLMLYDLYGRLITKTSIHQGENTMDISREAPGTFILQIRQPDGTVYNEKIIKK